MSNKIVNQFLFVIILMGCFSCTSTKNLTYFNDIETAKKSLSSTGIDAEHKIEPNEMFSIHVTSPTTEGTANKLFNEINDYRSTSITTMGVRVEFAGYIVNTSGYIDVPLVGSVKAAGLTKTQLKELITRKIIDKRYLIDPIVEVRFLNYEVTVLGEVAKPTVVSVPNEKISLLKALGAAGDITAYGRKDNVMIIREEDGKKNAVTVNLNSVSFLQSPYYYLQPNDVVYVSTTDNRAASVDRTRLILPSILSAISVLVLVVDRLIKK